MTDTSHPMLCPRVDAQVAIDAHDVIGEGPTWDRARGRLLWSDNERGIIHAAEEGQDGHWTETARWSLNRVLAAAIPRAQGGLVVCGGVEVFLLSSAGEETRFAALDEDPAAVRFNDAKCDPQGRLWAGTLATDFTARAGLYRIDPDGRITQILRDVRLANGLGWSPDGGTFYFVDSLTGGVRAFDFDGAWGRLSRPRELFAIERGAGAFNGLTVDQMGFLWVAVTGAGEVRQYSPAGALHCRVSISTPGATSCAFGGRDGEQLFITSLGRRMPDVALALGLAPGMLENREPHSGALFVCRPGARGSGAVPFAG